LKGLSLEDQRRRVFTVSLALGFAKAERCQANHADSSPEMAGRCRPFRFPGGHPLRHDLRRGRVIDCTKERVPDRVRDLDAVFETLGSSEIESLSVVKRGAVVDRACVDLEDPQSTTL